MKLKYIVAHVNNSEQFDIKHCWIKVKVTVGLQKFFQLPQYQLSGPITQFWYKLGNLNKHVCLSDINMQNL